MKKIFIGFFLIGLAMFAMGCKSETTFITHKIQEEGKRAVLAKNENVDTFLLDKGVEQMAFLWKEEDGSREDFVRFCEENFQADPKEKQLYFEKLSHAYEYFWGTYNQLDVELKKAVTLTGEELRDLDYLLGNYSTSAHFMDDMFANKMAFLTVLNFPNYTLEEKNTLGKDWTDLEWAYARMGDIFTSRIGAEVYQQMSEVYGNAENYIAAYNIYMGKLLNEKGERLFPGNMVLLSHWNLRDEIKSNYSAVPNHLEKQQMIYEVMKHIVNQTIPEKVINSDEYDWNPILNKCYKDGKEVELAAEPDTRYEYLLENFRMEKELDAYYPNLPTGILRNFEGSMEFSSEDIEQIFITLLSSPVVKEVAALIQSDLGRELRPFDIWYNGFKSEIQVSEDELTRETTRKYPTPEDFEKDMPVMLQKLGFSSPDARYLAENIVVEGARGSGHAAGGVGRWEKARLRTRIGKDGMDYKGYNIAVHEFGHNVEQTLSLKKTPYYMMNGVPNTAFTEALAFIFQKRDLQLLGYSNRVDENMVLDIFWNAYEIMGVSLVDMYTWRWMYEHPQATAEELKNQVLSIAAEVWNKYYLDVLGEKDSPILAIYSHMINAPMYLPNYPLGHIIEFQLEDYIQRNRLKGKDFAEMIWRVYSQGRLTPHLWMQKAVGESVSAKSLIKAVEMVVNRNQAE